MACLADHLARLLAGFDRAGFEADIIGRLDRLELKQRVQLIADGIFAALPGSAEARNRVLLKLLHPVADAGIELQSDADGIRGWGMLPLGAVVGRHGLDAFEDSLQTLRIMTSRFSAEYDVRYFLLADQERALGIMAGWIDDPDRHVRRLVSEGTRPRLPRAMRLPRLIADPSPTLPLLEALRDDDEQYLRRSVANHLNDIARDHPDRVAGIARDWMRGADRRRETLLRHACRTLIKQGHPATLEAFGYAPPEVEVELQIDSPAVEFGRRLAFSARLVSTGTAPQALIVDYVVHFRKANGQLAPKVFKWTEMTLRAGAEIALRRAHAIRPITTRRYYAGEQALSLRINGRDFGYRIFRLVNVPESRWCFARRAPVACRPGRSRPGNSRLRGLNDRDRGRDAAAGVCPRRSP